MRIAVCMITLRRPEGLARALDSIAAQSIDRTAHHITVVIVENEDSGPGHAVVERFRRTSWPSIHYGIETTRGIPFARNRALELAFEADPAVDAIAFLDDDETADPDWLKELVGCMERTSADVTTGPAKPRFPDGAPRWAIEGGFFDPPANRAHDTPTDQAYTNNVLMTTETARSCRPFFANELGMTGADDSHAFRRVGLNGGRIVWTDRAITWEWIPESRLSAQWVWKRAFRVGTSLPLIERMLMPRWYRRPLQLAEGCYRITKGVTFLIAFGAFGRLHRIRHIRQIYFGMGVLSSLRGYTYAEYTTVHGR